MTTSVTIDISDTTMREIDQISQYQNQPKSVVLAELMEIGLQE